MDYKKRYPIDTTVVGVHPELRMPDTCRVVGHWEKGVTVIFGPEVPIPFPVELVVDEKCDQPFEPRKYGDEDE